VPPSFLGLTKNSCYHQTTLLLLKPSGFDPRDEHNAEFAFAAERALVAIAANRVVLIGF
jgi:hypothetical protein